jgi:hypothetical protein
MGWLRTLALVWAGISLVVAIGMVLVVPMVATRGAD